MYFFIIIIIIISFYLEPEKFLAQQFKPSGPKVIICIRRLFFLLYIFIFPSFFLQLGKRLYFCLHFNECSTENLKNIYI
ncbi:hypothetical protein GLOIN_2v1718470 [Rhizophagus irregularis DAOM 181602=DAOM 197198]|uniref:Uncharacterized protein n=1 Tax=Rhizophagus irregularis (strain DAOM 181602 / DAOM 197198 / MUCL 43194) TaxID=747089 RepID=A0A2P4P3B1_RHIID|nr:hypothetical protein GLOIN_2v1718470 [Rhizophagus irregularis DAOM 181602=DAOM 197198]POG59879.1 hypothetical protein GLOIN_2v1718470 [Rhizophagus irregularis DAOM 181602=DAOM 197198]GET56525.1 hypothetical protein GLOIN_2v1718470 [Rhizophagus irregularis DAOM 181602=DAOM 197198]|eukprot:XP_025166745.1 hypothetical protein GLOIN_2v1718470 [Rhizophagus irregularis DAOM 181602=DAOM 197198]